MSLKSSLKKVLRKIDQHSPYPLFYSFVMSKDEKNIFDNAIKDSRHYLEFGLGGSTIRAIQKSNANVYAVESCPDWIASMRQYKILRSSENHRLHIFHVDIGPTRKWGFPEQDNNKDNFEQYSASIFQSMDRKLIDLALVDGRFRVACTLKIILECHENKGLRILIHDFWNREQYHILLKYLHTVNRANSIGLFSIKEDVDLEMVEKDYQEYKQNPE